MMQKPEQRAKNPRTLKRGLGSCDPCYLLEFQYIKLKGTPRLIARFIKMRHNRVNANYPNVPFN